MSHRIAMSIMLIFAGVAPALAEDDDFARDGIYAGINLAGAYYPKIDGDIDDGLGPLLATTNLEVEKPVGVGVRAGYRLFPHLAGEVQFQWFAPSESETDFYLIGSDPKIDFENVTALRVRTLNLTGNLKGYLLTGRIQPFVLVGGGLLHYEVEDELGLGLGSNGDDFVARFGGGVDVYFNRNFVLVIDSSYWLPTGSADQLNQIQVSVGLNYRF